MAFKLYSTAFQDQGFIPEKFTCDGKDISPNIHWDKAPMDTKSFALIVDDPDAPAQQAWVHWIVFNIPNNMTEIKTGGENLPNSISFGKNSWGKFNYNGPCPPRGTQHRYFFKMYALDNTLSLANMATKKEIEKAMKGHVLAKSELMGRYYRPL